SQKLRHSTQAGCPISRVLCEKWGFIADSGRYPIPLPGFPIRHSRPSTQNPLTPLFARLYSQLLSSQDFTRTCSWPPAPTPQKQRSYVLSTNKFSVAPSDANRAQRHKTPAAFASFEPGELRNPQRTAQAARACKGRTRNWEKSE